MGLVSDIETGLLRRSEKWRSVIDENGGRSLVWALYATGVNYWGWQLNA